MEERTDLGTDLGLRPSTRPNIAFVHCRQCHRPHLASQHTIFCPQQSISNNRDDVPNIVATPLALMFFPSTRPPMFSLLRVSSFSSLIDRPSTPYRYDTDEESLEDEERHWVSVTPLTSPNRSDATTVITLVSSEVPLIKKATSSYRKWLVSFRPWS